jgi:ABC-type amino acid transport substrate-binding protein
MKRTLLIFGVAIAALMTAAPTVAAEGTLRVLTYNTRPFFFKDAGGKPAGIEHDILEYHAKTHGQRLEVVWVDQFDDVLPRLLKGDGDVAAATLTVTPERQKQLTFSSSYFPVRVMLIEPKNQATAKLGDLAGATLATMHGTTYEKLLTGGVPRAQLLFGPDEEALFRLVASGKARAAAVDSAVAYGLLAQFPQLKLGIPLSTEQSLAFAVRRGSPLAGELSKTIAQLKDSKIYFRVLEKHLGAEAAKLVAAGKG